MELIVSSRAVGKKSELNKIRREGNIPAILYSKGEKGKEIVVDGAVFQKILNTVEKGTLSSEVFTLVIDGKKVKAILKDIQYQVTTYDIIHLDFEELHEDVSVTLKIPVKCVNMMECAGVKLGGILRQIIRYIKIRTLPKHIPSHFELDVRDLGLGHTMKLDKIALPSEVQPVTNLKEVAVVVSRR